MPDPISASDFGESVGGGGYANPGGIAKVVIAIVGDASQYVKAIRAAVNSTDKIVQGMGQTFNQMFDGANEGVRAWGRLIQQTARETGQSFSQVRENLLATNPEWRQYGANITDSAEAVKRLGGSAKEASRGTGDLFNSLKKIVGLGSGLLLVRQAIRFITNTIRESIDEFRMYTTEVFKLEVGIRAIQRRSGEAAGSMEEWKGFIADLREEFSVFSTRDLTAATSKVLLLTRELGFNKRQMEEVVTSSIILAETMGVKVEEAARRLTLFLDTGYSRGLAALGLQINRITVEELAHAEGMEKSWNQMSRNERATYSLMAVNKQLDAQREDAGRIVETFAGQIMELEAAQSDASLGIGKSAAFMMLAWETVKTFIITDLVPSISEAFEKLARTMIKTSRRAFVIITGTFSILAQIRDVMLDETGTKQLGSPMEMLAKATEDANGNFEMFSAQLEDELFPKLSEFENVAKSAMGSLAEAVNDDAAALENLDEVIAKMIKKIDAEMLRFERAQADAERRRDQKLEDQRRKFEQQRIDAFIRFNQKVLDINRKFAQRRDDAILKSEQKIQDIRRDGAQRLVDAQTGYRVEELRDQRKFNMDMARLEREFLFNLEDAVRERDARQVLMLMRRHSLDQQNLQESFDERRRQAEEDLELEQEMIRRNTQIRIQAERRALVIRLKQLEISRKREHEANQRALDRKLEQIDINNQRQRDRIEEDHKRKMEDLARQHSEKLTAIGEALGAEVDMNQEAINQLIKAWRDYYGWVGDMVEFGQGLTNSALQGLRVLQQAAAETGSGGFFGGSSTNPELSVAGRFAGGFQHGGSVVASRPTMALFGEGGPERATFTPLGGGGGERIGIDVRVDEGLKVELADGVMNELADIVINTERGR
jgi:hypothetical protein